MGKARALDSILYEPGDHNEHTAYVRYNDGNRLVIVRTGKGKPVTLEVLSLGEEVEREFKIVLTKRMASELSELLSGAAEFGIEEYQKWNQVAS